MFASRTDWELIPNNLSRALSRLRAEGVDVVDLTESNPTHCELDYAADEIRAALSSERVLHYDPDPRGMREAREAVCAYYATRGATLEPEQIVLTASTSEAYSHLFKLLLEPHEEVLVPVPSYPLFEYLAALADVELSAYPRGEAIDADELASRVDEATRALLVVNPTNPSGASMSSADRRAVAQVCQQRSLALVSDEVFLDYAPRAVTMAAQDDALTFTLSGLSKVCGLPQMKLAWIAVTGPSAQRDEALARLEVVADTYLSVSTAAQTAAATLLEGAPRLQEQIRERTRDNRKALADLFAGNERVRITSEDAGWYAVVRISGVQDEEELVLRLLEHDHVLVHPGYFYDYSGPARLVVSLLPPAQRFRIGAERLARRLKGV